MENHVKKFRTEKNLSQKELADYAGITRQTLSLIENNSETLNRVAVKLETFFTNSFFINDHFFYQKNNWLSMDIISS